LFVTRVYDVANERLILMAGGESHSFTKNRWFEPSGEAIFVDALTCPIVVDGDVRGGYGIARDISERKKAEVVWGC